MTSYEATHRKYFISKSHETGKLIVVTAKTLIGELIAGQHKYDMYKGDNYGWIDEAKEDIKHGMRIAKKRINELEQAARMLDNIQTFTTKQED